MIETVFKLPPGMLDQPIVKSIYLNLVMLLITDPIAGKVKMYCIKSIQRQTSAATSLQARSAHLLFVDEEILYVQSTFTGQSRQ